MVVDEYDEMKGSESEWMESIKSSKYNVGDDNVLNIDSTVIYITFTNSKCIKFFSSEHGIIRETDEMK